MLGKCKVLSNHMVYIKLSQVILFPYIIGRFQKKFWFLNSRIAGRGVNISHSASVSDRTCQTGSVYSRIWKLPVIFFLQLPMCVRCAAMRGAPQCAARTSLIGTTLAKLSKQLRNITYRQLFNKHTILSFLFLKMVVYCNKIKSIHAHPHSASNEASSYWWWLFSMYSEVCTINIIF